MKKTLFCAVWMFLTIACFSQTGKPKVTTAPKPAPPVLKNSNDSASYAMGIFLVNYMKNYGITKFNTSLITRAIADVQGNKPRLLNDDQCNVALVSYVNNISAQKSKPTIEAGEKFLAENKKRTGVVTTASGLQYEILTQGSGPLPTTNDTVIVNYIGKFITGQEFENSYNSGAPVKFKTDRVIKGWTEALLMMPAGSKWRVFIPYQLAYGTMEQPGMPAGSALIFDIELIEVKK